MFFKTHFNYLQFIKIQYNFTTFNLPKQGQVSNADIFHGQREQVKFFHLSYFSPEY